MSKLLCQVINWREKIVPGFAANYYKLLTMMPDITTALYFFPDLHMKYLNVAFIFHCLAIAVNEHRKEKKYSKVGCSLFKSLRRACQIFPQRLSVTRRLFFHVIFRWLCSHCRERKNPGWVFSFNNLISCVTVALCFPRRKKQGEKQLFLG